MQNAPLTALGHVLVVDDDPVILKLQALVLDKQGFACHVASSAVQALHILRNEHVDALLCDLHMPVNSGVDLLRTLRKEGGFADLPVAIVTGDLAPSAAIVEEIEALGARLVADVLRGDALIALAESLVAQTRP